MAYLDPFSQPYPHYTTEEEACGEEALQALQAFPPRTIKES